MTIKDIMEKLDLSLAGGESGLLNSIKGVYVCDLLSWVMAHAAQGEAWITIQTHPNIVAVASLLELSCIIIPENAVLEDDTVQKANEHAIPLLVSGDSAYEICSKLSSIIKG
jgi:serine kinase of HPr protein (carbohydrate metabolism regulator)